ncbi:unnamed protein product [Medioppia subpectinata]|uniref:Uncharacterized protein n=1 Tax=Medioppia subpectinata TaxID=1979941 RepID=A0A7R9Q222_9ACAR|nr:unnamed protein product [Medioppia subpectinata]CAG2109838.1 unnamed protein product [Medioppia subpectinata]
MPIALTIDETILCVNSGIPDSQTKVMDQLKQIRGPLKTPWKEAPLVWQMLTNRPMKGLKKFEKLENMAGMGFGEEATKSFLNFNGLKRIICGNNITNTGIACYFGGRVLTIHTSSRSKEDNKSVALLIADRMIRIIRLNTTSDRNTSKK